MTEIRRVATAGLRPEEVVALRDLLWQAFAGDEDEAFTEHDWEHALGGVHILVEADGLILAHGAVVERELEAGGRTLRTGYVEAVATRVGHQRSGHGSMLMREVNAIIHERFQLGALGTGVFSFYEQLGWERWRGPAFVRTRGVAVPTPDDDGYILVLRTASTRDLDLDLPISCELREGDVW